MKRLKLICCFIGFMFAAVAGFAQGHWNCNIYDYQYDMTVYLQLQVSETVVTDYSDYEIAAFCEDECRGVATVETVSANGQTVTYGYLRVRSNVAAGENIMFKCYKKSTAEEINVTTTSVVFSAQDMIGLPSSPFVLELNTAAPELYKVIFRCEDGTIVKEELVEVGAPIEIPEAPSKEGYTFIGWGDVLSSMPSHDVEYTAQYTVNSYTVRFLSDGTVVGEYVLAYGSPIEVPENNPVKEGHTFTGWGDVLSSVPAYDVEYTAQYTVNSYTVRFLSEGTLVGEYVLAYGSPIEVPENEPVKEGHTFIGWGDVLSSVPAYDVEYTAQYTVNSYTVRFLSEGTLVGEYVLAYGSPIEVPENDPVKEGHTFTGWGDVLSSVPAYDVEYTAQYTVNSYNLVYVVDGEEYAAILLEYGASIESLPFPEREGHTFSGWSREPAVMPAEDVTVTGSFTVNKYAVIYYIGDAEYARDLVEFGQEIVLRSYKPDDDRYSFDGWDGELYETMPAHDLEYHAILIDAIQDVKLNHVVDVYTLTGVKIRSAVSMDRLQAELPKGIYIIGGKKYMVK